VRTTGTARGTECWWNLLQLREHRGRWFRQGPDGTTSQASPSAASAKWFRTYAGSSCSERQCPGGHRGQAWSSAAISSAT